MPFPKGRRFIKPLGAVIDVATSTPCRGGAIDRWQPSGLSAHSLHLRRLGLNEICEGGGDGGGMSGRRVGNAFGRTSSEMPFGSG